MLQLERDVLDAIRYASTDFRTTESLARQFKTNHTRMMVALDTLWRRGKIRHPVGYERHMHHRDRNEAEWWRAVEHGYTRGEKKRMLFALIGVTPLSNGEPGGQW